MDTDKPSLAEKKVKYIASIIYLLVFAFIVGGSYINQQKNLAQADDNKIVILPEAKD